MYVPITLPKIYKTTFFTISNFCRWNLEFAKERKTQGKTTDSSSLQLIQLKEPTGPHEEAILKAMRGGRVKKEQCRERGVHETGSGEVVDDVMVFLLWFLRLKVPTLSILSVPVHPTPRPPTPFPTRYRVGSQSPPAIDLRVKWRLQCLLPRDLCFIAQFMRFWLAIDCWNDKNDE